VAGAPAYVNGLVIAGLSGVRSPIDRNDGRVVALDAKTGAVKWTFHVVPGPGEAGTKPGRKTATSGNAAAARSG
jgi:outer membrane protein assembly factor BamB